MKVKIAIFTSIAANPIGQDVMSRPLKLTLMFLLVLKHQTDQITQLDQKKYVQFTDNYKYLILSILHLTCINIRNRSTVKKNQLSNSNLLRYGTKPIYLQ